MDADAWGAEERNRLRRALTSGQRESGSSDRLTGADATHRLGCAIARRDTDAIAALSRDAPSPSSSSPLANLRLALASAAIGMETRHDDRWSAIDRRRVEAAVALGRPARTLQVGSTPFLFEQAIPIITAELNGKSGYFIVDTGAPHSALSQSWCRRNGTHFAPGVDHEVDDGAGRAIAATTVRIETLVAGGVAADVPAIMFNFPGELDVAGILSPLDAFPGVPITLDYVRKRFATGEDGPNGCCVALFWEGGVPLVHAKIADADAILLLDSGAGGELLCESFADRFATTQLIEASTSNAAGMLPIRIGLELPLSIGGQDPRPHSFALMDCAGTGSDTDLIGHDGIVGGGWMAGRRITIDADRLHLRWDDGS